MSEMHPVQHDVVPWQITDAVTRAAYEVYAHVHGPQPALVDLAGRGCRGGFGMGELIALLYARSFPRDQWRARVDEAIEGMSTGWVQSFRRRE